MRTKNTRLAGLLLGLSLVVVAFNLRPFFPSLSVLLSDISPALNLSGSQVGSLTTLPVLCLGLFAPLAPWLAQKMGMEKVLFWMLLILAAGHLVRSVGQIYFLYAGAILAGSAIAIGNVLLPAMIKRDFPSRLSLMTALYTMAICGGGALAAALTVPLKNMLFESWRLALGVWACPLLLMACVWLPQVKAAHNSAAAATHKIKGLWRDGLAWQVTFFMGLQSAGAYIIYAWLAPILHGRGLTEEAAGQITCVVILLQMAGCLIVPMIIGKRTSQSFLNVTLCLMSTFGFIGLVFAPLGSVWLWVFCQGIGQGGMLAAAIMVIVLRARDAHVAAHLSGMAQSIGYCIAALGPILVGMVYDISEHYPVASLVFIVMGSMAAFFGFLAGRPIFCKAVIEL